MGKYPVIILNQMISALDAKAPDDKKENFYHGLLLGLLRSEINCLILSNAESGDGFSDILIEPESLLRLTMHPALQGLEKACEEALRQIREKRYEERLRSDGRTDVLIYGIAFSRKRCKVISERYLWQEQGLELI